MGDPRKLRKKYSTPIHPWQKERIEEEKELVKVYGFKNRKEIWKVKSMLNKFSEHAKRSVKSRTEQSKKEMAQIIAKLNRIGLVNKNATTDDILSLKLESLLERRLQTLVFKKGLARSVKQARQFIVHGHITVANKKITSPSYIVSKEDEGKMSFNPKSSLNDINHPERVPPAPLAPVKKETKEAEAKKAGEDKKEKTEEKPRLKAKEPKKRGGTKTQKIRKPAAGGKERASVKKEVVEDKK